MKTPDKLADPRIASGCAINHSDVHLSSKGDPLSDLAISNPGVSEPEKVVSLVVQRIMELPPVTKKVLAMYYYENTQLSEIAACFNLPESRISEMHSEAVALLRSYILNALPETGR
jgi:RNA polymerase sigma factor for flagellar operon FliA